MYEYIIYIYIIILTKPFVGFHEKGFRLQEFSTSWVKFGITDLHITILDSYEYYKNRYSEGDTLLKGFNEILKYLPCFIHFYSTCNKNRYRE